MKHHTTAYAFILALLIFVQLGVVADAQQISPPPPPPPLTTTSTGGASAQCLDAKDPSAICLPSPSGIVDLWDLYGRIFEFARFITAAVFVIMIMIGAFKMLMAKDNESKFNEGKKTIQYAAIGAAVIMVAGGIVSVIKEFLSSK